MPQNIAIDIMARVFTSKVFDLLPKKGDLSGSVTVVPVSTSTSVFPDSDPGDRRAKVLVGEG